MQIFKKVNAKCQVKGCRSTGRTVDTFYISRSSGYGPSIIMCRECIDRAYGKLHENDVVKAAENAEETAEATKAAENAEETAEADKAKKTKSKKADA